MATGIPQSAFVIGEVSPNAYGRVDLAFYFKALALARNVYVYPQGFVQRREGTLYINNTAGDNPARNIEFQFNTEQTYRLEFSAGQFKVYKDDVLQTTVNTSPISALTADQIKEMRFTQSADTLILTHKAFKTIVITRTSDTSWTAVQATFKGVPVFAFSGVTLSNPAHTLTPSAVTGEITLTLSGSFWVAATHEKQYVIINNGLVFIETVTSATVAKGQVVSALSSLTAATSGNWTLETGYEDVWSNTRGWPACVTFHRGRLYFAAGSRPQTVWGSRVADFFNFDKGSGLDADGLEFSLNDDSVNAILDIFSGRTLQIFTTGSEFFVRSSTTKPITPVNIVDLVERGTSYGSAGVRPITIDGSTLFVEKGGAVIRDFVYSDVEQSYQSVVRSDLADHFVREPLDVAIRPSQPGIPVNHVFFVNSDGTMAVYGTQRSQEFSSWSLFETDGLVEDVCAVGTDIYLIVKRSINGVDKRFVEKLQQGLRLDCAVVATSGSPTTSWSGFSHLNGEECRVFGDDFVLDRETPSAGSITTSEAVSEVEVGLFFAFRVKPLPLDAEIAGTPLTGKYRQIVAVNLNLIESREFVVKLGNNTFRPTFRTLGDDLLDQPVQSFTGWKKVWLNGGITRDPAPEITQEEATEFKMLSMITEVN